MLPNATTVFRFNGTPSTVVLADFFTEDFVLLEPTYVYNTDDLRFYRLGAPLQATGLPARLSAVDGNPRGDYHVVPIR